ncbi:MAG: P-loop NTPase [Acidimicrobiales bacterium]
MKTLVVASGKGGTGKTTFTAVFAYLAAHMSPVGQTTVLADSDVEGSNLPLALGAGAESSEDFLGSEKAVLDTELCQHCGLCADSCRFGALSLSDEGRPIFDEWSCEGCGSCAAACPEDAIRFERRAAGKLMTGGSCAGPMVFAQLRPAEDLSGKLVTQVCGRARQLAGQQRAELVLVDGPPGVGCPAIASLTNADALLAVAEPSSSGVHDLRRLLALARQLELPVRVVLNKADLFGPGAQHLREACQDDAVEVIGEVPFDDELPAVLEHLCEDGGADLSTAGWCPGLRALADVWQEVARWLGSVPARAYAGA